MESLLTCLKAMADGNRLRVIVMLLRYDELCVCQIVEVLHLANATVSRHMSILQSARLVQSRKEGRWVYYRLADAFPGLLRAWLEDVLSNSGDLSLDQNQLEQILLCDPEEICRQQKVRKTGN